VVVNIEGVPPHDLRHYAATVIARNPNVTLRELTATIGHSSHVAALRYHHAIAEQQGNRRLPRWCDHCYDCSKSSVAVRIRP
jgi:integrase